MSYTGKTNSIHENEASGMSIAQPGYISILFLQKTQEKYKSVQIPRNAMAYFA
jgi:hypothetical protein